MTVGAETPQAVPRPGNPRWFGHPSEGVESDHGLPAERAREEARDPQGWCPTQPWELRGLWGHRDLSLVARCFQLEGVG